MQRLLVLDEYKAHKSQAVRETAKGKKTDIVYVPGGCTSLAQPLDVSVNKPFNVRIRQLWEQWAFDNLRGTSRVHHIRQDWIPQSWTLIDAGLIVKSFLRCGISNAMDGSQDDEVWDHFPPNETEVQREGASLLFSGRIHTAG